MPALTLTRRQALQGAALAAFPLRSWAKTPALTFLAVGDWGRHGQFHQKDVADRMGESAHQIDSRFVISVGDNFYDDGITGVDDPAWRTSFEDVYTAPSLQTPWYVILGNHDYRGNSQAQIDYSKTSPRWRMPARYYSFTERAPDGATVEIFMLDTSPFIRGYYKDGGALVKVVGQDTVAQLAWFDKALSDSKADWKIVIGHHPIYSGGKPGKAGTEPGDDIGGGAPELIAQLDPILQRHAVPLYLNGHDHDLQHVKRGLTDYICTGAGSKMKTVCPTDGSDFCSLQQGFIACAVDKSRIRIAYRDFTGAELHVVEIPQRA